MLILEFLFEVVPELWKYPCIFPNIREYPCETI